MFGGRSKDGVLGDLHALDTGCFPAQYPPAIKVGMITNYCDIAISIPTRRSRQMTNGKK